MTTRFLITTLASCFWLIVSHAVSAQNDPAFLHLVDHPEQGVFAGVGQSGLIAVLDSETKAMLLDLSLTNQDEMLISADWNSNGDLLAVGSSNGTIRIFCADLDATNCQPGIQLSSWVAHANGLTDIDWHPTLPLIASSTQSFEQPAIITWDSRTYERINESSPATISDIEWNQTGTILAVADINLGLGLFNQDLSPILTPVNVDVLINPLSSIAWHPDSNKVALGGAFVPNLGSPTIVVWDTINNIATSTLAGHEGTVGSLVWIPQDDLLASTSFDGRMNLWNPQTETLLESIDGASAFSLLWLEEQEQLLSFGGINRPFLQIDLSPPPSQECSYTAVNSTDLVTHINDANANGIADTICLADGTYTLTSSQVTDYGTNGLPLITSDITLVGLGENVVIEREASAPAFRLFHVKDTGALTLENVTLSNGDAGTRHGGAIYAKGAVTLRDVTITDNFARRGGGVRVNGAPLTITGSQFEMNTADREGGAIYVSGTGSSFDLSTSQFIGNSATNSGGAMYLSGTTSTLTANDVIFQSNQAKSGGAIFAVPATLDITNSTFDSNSASQNDGGAIYTSSSSAITVANSINGFLHSKMN